MRIALDATYSVDPRPTGIGIYSNALLIGLPNRFPDDMFYHCYRPKPYMKKPRNLRPNVRQRLLGTPLPLWGPELFHGVNQRVDKRYTKRVVSTFHDLFVMTEQYSAPAFRERFTEQAKLAAQNSDLIIAVSQFTAEQVNNLLGVERSRIRVIPHGVSPPSPELWHKRENIILTVGALQVRKNFVRLIDAFERLSPDWRLILAGARTGYRAGAVIERLRNSDCKDRIQLVGYQWPAELEVLYNRASIFAFPSLDEGFGLPVLEAMAHGVPVITSNRPALVEVAGDAALIVDPQSTDDLEYALERFITEPTLRNQYIQRGLERAKLYPWDRTLRATHDVYKELLS